MSHDMHTEPPEPLHIPAPALALAEQLREHIAVLPPADRVELFLVVTDGYCPECGAKHGPILNCQCFNDE